jgi:hypothetical protein
MAEAFAGDGTSRIRGYGSTISGARLQLTRAVAIEVVIPRLVVELGWTVEIYDDEDRQADIVVARETPGFQETPEVWVFAVDDESDDGRDLAWRGINLLYQGEPYMYLLVRPVAVSPSVAMDSGQFLSIIASARKFAPLVMTWDYEQEGKERMVAEYMKRRDQRVTEGVPEELVDEVIEHEMTYGEDPFV